MSNKETITQWLEDSAYKNFHIEGDENATVFYANMYQFSSFALCDLKRIPKGWQVSHIWPNIRMENGYAIAYLTVTIRKEI